MTTEVSTSASTPPLMDRLAYKPNDAAAVLGIGRNRVFELIKSGELGSVKYGGTRLIPREAIARFLALDSEA